MLLLLHRLIIIHPLRITIIQHLVEVGSWTPPRNIFAHSLSSWTKAGRERQTNEKLAVSNAHMKACNNFLLSSLGSHCWSMGCQSIYFVAIVDSSSIWSSNDIIGWYVDEAPIDAVDWHVLRQQSFFARSSVSSCSWVCWVWICALFLSECCWIWAWISAFFFSEYCCIIY